MYKYLFNYDLWFQQWKLQPISGHMLSITSQTHSIQGFPAPRTSSTHCNQVPEKKQSDTASRISSKHVEQSETKFLHLLRYPD